MSESQGFTPAEQDGTTPSTTEQYLTLAEAVLKVADLEAEVAKLKADREYWRIKADERLTTIEQARESIQEVLSGDVNPQSTFDDFQTAFELLGVTLTREVEVEITVTWRGTMTLPTGVDPEDLDIDDFGIEISGHYEWDSNFDGMHDYRISER